jgi:hypothetical protein
LKLAPVVQKANQQPTPTLPVCYVVSLVSCCACVAFFSLLARVCRYFALNSLSSNSLAFDIEHHVPQHFRG